MEIDNGDDIQDAANNMLVIKARMALRKIQKTMRASRWAKGGAEEQPR